MAHCAQLQLSSGPMRKEHPLRSRSGPHGENATRNSKTQSTETRISPKGWFPKSLSLALMYAENRDHEDSPGTEGPKLRTLPALTSKVAVEIL